MNSALALDQSRILARQLSQQVGDNPDDPTTTAFIQAAFEQVLAKPATPEELIACQRFLQQHAQLVQAAQPGTFPPGGQSKQPPSPIPHQRARENLIHVLLSHNLFVTIR